MNNKNLPVVPVVFLWIQDKKLCRFSVFLSGKKNEISIKSDLGLAPVPVLAARVGIAVGARHGRGRDRAVAAGIRRPDAVGRGPPMGTEKEAHRNHQQGIDTSISLLLSS